MKNILFIFSCLIFLCCSQKEEKKETPVGNDFLKPTKESQSSYSTKVKETNQDFEQLWEKAKNTPVNGSSNYIDTVSREPIHFRHSIHVKDNKIDCKKKNLQSRIRVSSFLFCILCTYLLVFTLFLLLYSIILSMMLLMRY